MVDKLNPVQLEMAKLRKHNKELRESHANMMYDYQKIMVKFQRIKRKIDKIWVHRKAPS